MKLNRIAISAAMLAASAISYAQTVAPVLTVGTTGDPAQSPTSLVLTANGTAVQSSLQGVGLGTVQIGLFTSSPGQGNLVAGTGAMALPGVNFGAALGNGSIVDRSNTVSFGVASGLGYLPNSRILANVASGQLSTDAANMGQLWAARDLAISSANMYTDNALTPVNYRLTNAEAQTANNTSRLDQHDAVLADHDQRITTAQTTADTAMSVATSADAKATTALARSDEALATANQARQEVAALSGRIDEVRKDSFRGTASAMAMAGALPTLNPGEKAWYLRSGVYGGQAAIAGGIAVSNWSGHVFDVKVSNDGKHTGFSAGVSGKF